MRIGEAYIQYSKIFTAVVGVLYAVQVGATIALVCHCPDAAEYLLDILSTTTGLFGLVFGCYTGNSVVEKVNTTRKAVSAAMQPGAGSDVG